MEKDTSVVARYHYDERFYVEVICQVPHIGARDYWLCNRNSENKLFLFSKEYEGLKREERLIARNICNAIERYERPAASCTL